MQESPSDLDLELTRLEVSPSPELFTVAIATLNWWETHRNDMTWIAGCPVSRYPYEPDFVTFSEAIVRGSAGRSGLCS